MENLALSRVVCRKCKQEKYIFDMARGNDNLCKPCKNARTKAANERNFGKTSGKRWGTMGNYSKDR